MYYVTYFEDGFLASTNTEIIERLSDYNFVKFDSLDGFMEEYAKRMSVVFEVNTPIDDADEFIGSLVDNNVIRINKVQ